MTLGERIKEARKEKGITQKELATLIKKGFSTVQKYEIDVIEPPVSVLQKIADVLEIPPSRLIIGVEGKKISEMNSEELVAITETLDFLDTITNPSQTSQQVKEQDAHIRAAISKRKKVLDAFDKLNSLGKEKAVERVEELAEITKYTTPDPDNNDSE